MSAKQHVVRLTPEQRAACEAVLRGGRSSALAHRRARVLLAADAAPGRPRRTDAQVAGGCGVSARTVARVRAAFAVDGFAAALRGQPRPRPVPPKLDGAAEARLVALACSPPPAGRARWSLRLLADRALLTEGLPPLSRELVRRTLKKTSSSPGSCGAG